jgi:predicted XRE-type DNA-binding protein
MDARKRAKLAKLGGRVTTAADFLGMSADEAALVELRLELAAHVRKHRLERGMTQAELAKAIGSSQSRIAKLEAADPQASLDSIVRALAATGAKISVKVA